MEDDFIHSGLTAYMDENYRTAIDQFTRSIQKNSDNSEVLIYRGISYIQLGDYSNAIQDFDNAEKLTGPSYQILFNKAKAYFLNMDSKNGQTELEKLRTVSDLTSEQMKSIEELSLRFS